MSLMPCNCMCCSKNREEGNFKSISDILSKTGVNIEPWKIPPLDKWSICGMNHYHVKGKKMIFVSMVKDGKCITSEGEDNWVIWNNLALQAEAV